MVLKNLRTTRIVLIILTLAIVAALIGIAVKARFYNKGEGRADATETSDSLSSEADFEAGSTDNIDSTSVPGQLSMTDTGEYGKIDTSSGSITAIQSPGTASNVIDGDWDTYWQAVVSNPPVDQEWSIDMGQQIHFNKVVSKFTGVMNGVEADQGFMFVYGSNNGSDWTVIKDSLAPGTTEYTFPAYQDYRYVRVLPNMSCGPNTCSMKLYEFEIYGDTPASATHTSGATQIDGTANIFEWQTFTPTYTEPANTDISFKLRTSTDGATWTAWSASQTPASGTPLDISALVTSISGNDKYRYIQVETTFSNTDGASTPTLLDYSIGYHINIKPDKPVAQSVTIGS